MAEIRLQDPRADWLLGRANTLVGIGAPIFLGQGDVTGSLSFIVSRAGLKDARIEELRAAVKVAAAEVSERLDLVMSVTNGGNQASRSPRRLAAGTR